MGEMVCGGGGGGGPTLGMDPCELAPFWPGPILWTPSESLDGVQSIGPRMGLGVNRLCGSGGGQGRGRAGQVIVLTHCHTIVH